MTNLFVKQTADAILSEVAVLEPPVPNFPRIDNLIYNLVKKVNDEFAGLLRVINDNLGSPTDDDTVGKSLPIER